MGTARHARIEYFLSLTFVKLFFSLSLPALVNKSTKVFRYHKSKKLAHNPSTSFQLLLREDRLKRFYVNAHSHV